MRRKENKLREKLKKRIAVLQRKNTGKWKYIYIIAIHKKRKKNQ